MTQTNQTNRNRADKDSLFANIALLYYGQGLTQSEIAKRMQVSRATIVNMLRESRERGIVEIRVDGKHLSSSNLARDVRNKFGLQDVYIATPDTRNIIQNRSALLSQVGRVGATALLDIIEPGYRVGVAWGETIMAVADMMPRTATDNVEICQLIGAMNSARVPASENCAIQIASKLEAKVFTLHAPGIVATSEMATTFRNEPTIQGQLMRLRELDMTVASIGTVFEDTHLQAAGMASAEELATARAKGAVGIICCRFINEKGTAVVSSPDSRLIAASLENLRSPLKKLLVVCGSDRAAATLAAIRGQLITHLCVDHWLALKLLENEKDPE